MSDLKASVILLAAGTSRRMGGRDKLLLEYKGKTLLQWAFELLVSLPLYEKILVTSKTRLEQINIQYSIVPALITDEIPAKVELSHLIHTLNLPSDVHAIINPTPEKGQSESLRLGLEAASGQWYLFLAADQPLLTCSCLQPLFQLAKTNTDKIIFPSINGKPCTPTLFPARYRENLQNLTGDTGGRAIRAANPEACLPYEVENPECFIDIDNEEDYRLLMQNAECRINTP